MTQRLVKVVGLCVVAIVIGVLSSCGDDSSEDLKPDALLEFWRGVFTRPKPEETTRVAGNNSELIALGGVLFRDRRLSGAKTRSCASCHMPSRAFSDTGPTAVGLNRQNLPRNVPTLFNLAWGRSFNWDGSAPTLEDQVVGPIEHANELGGSFPQIVARLNGDDDMVAMFQEAFWPNSTVDVERPQISKTMIVTALASYVRSLVSPIRRFDTWVAGDDAALSRDELQGFRLFVGKGGCVGCHAGWRMSDDEFHDIGLRLGGLNEGSVTPGKKGVAAFKTPTLRGVSTTAPYMHDGSLASLDSVVQHYARGVVTRKGLAELLKREISFSAEERMQLVAFLKTL